MSQLSINRPFGCYFLRSVFMLATMAGFGIFGGFYAATWGGKAYFVQERICGAAVMLAAGHGFTHPADDRTPEIMEFLKEERSRLTPDMIPADMRTQPPTFLEREHRYLVVAIGTVWRIFGIQWKSLGVLYGLLYFMVAVSSYGLLRLCAQPLLAFAGTAIIIFSPGFIYSLPHLRDFSKAAFILSAVWLLALLITRSRPPKVQYLLSLTIGLIIGAGLGFRQDLLICFPAAVVVVALLSPGELKHNWKHRIAMLLIMVSAFFVAALPMLKTMRDEGSKSMHRISGGFAAVTNRDLALIDAPYEVMPLFLDDYIYAITVANAMLGDNGAEPLSYGSSAYDKAGLRYNMRVFATFPRDMLLRWMSAVHRTLNYSFVSITTHYHHGWGRNFWIDLLLRVRLSLLGWLSGHGTLMALILFIALWVRSPRFALAYIFLMFYLCGYVSLQYHFKHAFHLEMAFWWTLIALIQQLAHCAGPFMKKLFARIFTSPDLKGLSLKRPAKDDGQGISHPPSKVLSSIVSGSCAAAVIWVAIYVALTATGAFQSHQVRKLFTAYAEAELRPLEMKLSPLSSSTRIEVPEFLLPENMTEKESLENIQSGVLALDIEKGDAPWLIHLEYTALHSGIDHKYSITIEPQGANEPKLTRVFFPIINSPLPEENPRRVFRGLRTLSENVGKIHALYDVQDLRRLPMLLSLQLAGLDGTHLQNTSLRFEKSLAPLELRYYNARSSTILPNGDFADWPEGDVAPKGAIAPGGDSHIAKAPRLLFSRGHSLKQVWTEARGDLSPLQRFHWAVEEVEEGRYYELFFQARFLDDVAVFMDIWHCPDDTLGSDSSVPVRLHQIRLRPRRRTHLYSHRFFVPARHGKCTLLLVPRGLPTDERATVVWTDIRIVEASYGSALTVATE